MSDNAVMPKLRKLITHLCVCVRAHQDFHDDMTIVEKEYNQRLEDWNDLQLMINLVNILFSHTVTSNDIKALLLLDLAEGVHDDGLQPVALSLCDVVTAYARMHVYNNDLPDNTEAFFRKFKWLQGLGLTALWETCPLSIARDVKDVYKRSFQLPYPSLSQKDISEKGGSKMENAVSLLPLLKVPLLLIDAVLMLNTDHVDQRQARSSLGLSLAVLSGHTSKEGGLMETLLDLCLQEPPLDEKDFLQLSASATANTAPSVTSIDTAASSHLFEGHVTAADVAKGLFEAMAKLSECIENVVIVARRRVSFLHLLRALQAACDTEENRFQEVSMLSKLNSTWYFGLLDSELFEFWSNSCKHAGASESLSLSRGTLDYDTTLKQYKREIQVALWAADPIPTLIKIFKVRCSERQMALSAQCLFFLCEMDMFESPKTIYVNDGITCLTQKLLKVGETASQCRAAFLLASLLTLDPDISVLSSRPADARIVQFMEMSGHDIVLTLYRETQKRLSHESIHGGIGEDSKGNGRSLPNSRNRHLALLLCGLQYVLFKLCSSHKFCDYIFKGRAEVFEALAENDITAVLPLSSFPTTPLSAAEATGKYGIAGRMLLILTKVARHTSTGFKEKLRQWLSGSSSVAAVAVGHHSSHSSSSSHLSSQPVYGRGFEVAEAIVTNTGMSTLPTLSALCNLLKESRWTANATNHGLSLKNESEWLRGCVWRQDESLFLRNEHFVNPITRTSKEKADHSLVYQLFYFDLFPLALQPCPSIMCQCNAPGYKKHVMISYNWGKNNCYAHYVHSFYAQLKKELGEHRIGVWLDDRDIPGGAEITPTFLTAARNAGAMIGFISSGYALSGACMAEIKEACEPDNPSASRIPYIPCLIQPYEDIEGDLKIKGQMSKFQELFHHIPRTTIHLSVAGDYEKFNSLREKQNLVPKFKHNDKIMSQVINSVLYHYKIGSVC